MGSCEEYTSEYISTKAFKLIGIGSITQPFGYHIIKDSLRKPNMKRPYTSVTNCQGLRFARFETKLYGHFIGKFGPASHRRSTAHPFLL